MTFGVFFVACWVTIIIAAKLNIPGAIDTDTLIILAILSAGEVISWNCKK